MPIHHPPELRRLDDAEFKQVTYEVMEVVFAIHNEMGRLFDVGLYEEAAIHFLGPSQASVQPVEISVGGLVIGRQKLLLASPDTSFCVTVLNKDKERYGEQLRRVLRHTPLKATQWINVDRRTVTFTTIRS